MKLQDKLKVLEEQIKILEGVYQTLNTTCVVDNELSDAHSFLAIVIDDLKEQSARLCRLDQ